MNGRKTKETGADSGASAWLFDLRIPAVPGRLKALRALLASELLHGAAPVAAGDEIIRAVDEACQNVIRHAYGDERGDLVVSLRRDRDRLEVEIRDFAARVDPATFPRRDLDELRPGGLGLHFIYEIMDEVDFRAPPGEETGNILLLAKKLAKADT